MIYRNIQTTTARFNNELGCVVIPTSCGNSPANSAEIIMNALYAFQKKFPQCRTLILPESTFPFPLNQIKKYISLWDLPDITILLGSHRYEDDHVYNTLYCIRNGSIITYYDKVHCMFFTEKVPLLWSMVPGAETLFLHNKRPFDPGKGKNDFIIPSMGLVQPLICSDLFFLYKTLDTGKIYVCIVNDSWFSTGYIPRLMFLHAKVVAAIKKSRIIYCGYRYCAIIDSDGNSTHLPTLIF